MGKRLNWTRGALLLLALLGSIGFAYGKDDIVSIPEVRVDSVIYKVLKDDVIANQMQYAFSDGPNYCMVIIQNTGDDYPKLCIDIDYWPNCFYYNKYEFRDKTDFDGFLGYQVIDDIIVFFINTQRASDYIEATGGIKLNFVAPPKPKHRIDPNNVNLIHLGGREYMTICYSYENGEYVKAKDDRFKPLYY